ncbi:MAG: DUF6069 family protein [Thermomicrobium sp.]|nr:DUF6069 family protein [Thermomicrobium sp.]MDW8060411.1 DUF6069 family protein [Thermomicrobium sp.]
MVLFRYGIVAAIVAAFVNTLLWLIARAVGVSLRVQPPGRPESQVDLSGVVLLTVVPILLGTGFYALLRRWTRRPFLIFAILALLVFVVLLVPPFAATDRPGSRFLLVLMHVVATVAILAGLFRFERQRPLV